MIPETELRQHAEEHELSEANVQRDYVFGWLISGLYRTSSLADALVLKGGNGLRKGYFPNTRFSDDLDFTTEQGLEGHLLLEEFNGVCRFARDAAGVSFDIGRNRIVDEHEIDGTKKVFKMKLYFKDFLTGADHITLSVGMDVTEYDRLYLPVQERQLIHPYSDVADCSTAIRCIKLEEALAEKMKCLLQRRYCYDLFDLVYGAFVTRDVEVDRSEMLNVFFMGDCRILRSTSTGVVGREWLCERSRISDSPNRLLGCFPLVLAGPGGGALSEGCQVAGTARGRTTHNS